MNGDQFGFPSQWRGENPHWTAEGYTSIFTASKTPTQRRSIYIHHKSICADVRPEGDVDDDDEPFNDALQITSIEVVSVEGRRLANRNGFTISYRQLDQHLVAVANTPDLNILQHSSQYKSHVASPSLLASAEDDEARIKELEHELAVSAETLAQKQESLIQSDKADDDSDCSGHVCVLNDMLQKVKVSLDTLAETLEHSCESVRSKLKSSLTGFASSHNTSDRQKPLHSDVEATATPHLPSFATAEIRPSEWSATVEAELSRAGISLDRVGTSRRTLQVVLGSVLLTLCIAGAGFCVCMRFRNPRARAEHLARCEERRTARQFRRAARRHAWKAWWNRHFPARRMTDYDEKRAMIVGQEAILENAMQAEIMELAMAAEEGRGGPSGCAASVGRPPSYRSRTSSPGPPPSYHRFAENGDVTIVNAGESTLCPSAAGTESVPDLTPDSSVRDLSPRQSFETLRTEFSAY